MQNVQVFIKIKPINRINFNSISNNSIVIFVGVLLGEGTKSVDDIYDYFNNGLLLEFYLFVIFF